MPESEPRSETTSMWLPPLSTFVNRGRRSSEYQGQGPVVWQHSEPHDGLRQNIKGWVPC
jgi:hypothetical protein